jgi:hypothetical protein
MYLAVIAFVVIVFALLWGLSMQIGRSATVAGLSLSESVKVIGVSEVGVNFVLPVAQAGSLTTRTSNTAGTLTMNSLSHGITTGSTIDIYWTGGQCRGATVGTVAGNSVPFTGATGTVLPAAATAITAMNPVVKNLAVVGNNLQGLALELKNPNNAPTVATDVGTFSFQSSAPAELLCRIQDNYDNVYVWDAATANTGDTNPLAGVTVATVNVSHASATLTPTVIVGAAFN